MQNSKNLFILKKDNNLKDYFFINLVSLIISSTFAITFIFFQAGSENKNILLTIKVLAISYFITLFPILLSNITSFLRNKNFLDFIKFEPFFSFIGLLIVVLFSLIAPLLDLSLLPIILGIIFLFYYLIVSFKNSILTFKNIPTILILIFFSLFILFTLWSSKYLVYYFSPIFNEKILDRKSVV